MAEPLARHLYDEFLPVTPLLRLPEPAAVRLNIGLELKYTIRTSDINASEVYPNRRPSGDKT